MNKVCIHFISGATVNHRLDDEGTKILIESFEKGLSFCFSDDDFTTLVKIENVSHITVQKRTQKVDENDS